jgi:hypothetical protein
LSLVSHTKIPLMGMLWKSDPPRSLLPLPAGAGARIRGGKGDRDRFLQTYVYQQYRACPQQKMEPSLWRRFTRIANYAMIMCRGDLGPRIQ